MKAKLYKYRNHKGEWEYIKIPPRCKVRWILATGKMLYEVE